MCMNMYYIGMDVYSNAMTIDVEYFGISVEYIRNLIHMNMYLAEWHGQADFRNRIESTLDDR